MIATLGYAKANMQWPRFTNLCATNPVLPGYLNEAQQRLRPKGLWVGTVQDYRICIASACVTLPRQAETIEQAWLCSTPMIVRSRWFESLPNSFGRLNANSGIGNQLTDRGYGFCTFGDLSGTAKIAVFTANNSGTDAGKHVLLQGRDVNNQFIRTVGDSVDGEQITLVSGITVSNTVFAPPGLVRVQKDATMGPVFAYAVDPSCPSGTVADITPYSPIQIAYWEPDELLPNYRRYLVPGAGVTNQQCGGCNGGVDTSCGSTSLTMTVKLAFVPALKDTDYLQIGNLPALKEEVISILKAERGEFQDSEAYEARAVRLLEEEVSSYEGHGVVQPFKVDASNNWGAGSIENVVTPWGATYWNP